MSETFVIMAGGTGGHVFPGLAVARELSDSGYRVEWLGTQAGIESTLVPDAGYPLHFLPVSGVRGKGLAALLAAPLMIAKSIIASWKILSKIKPIGVLGFGGFAAGPGAVAARMMGCPLLLHEQNSVLGTTNKLLQYLAQRRMEGFPDTFSMRRQTFFTGNPIRREVAQLLQGEQTVTVAVEPAERPINVLIVGGSRGARALNQNAPKLLHDIAALSKVALTVRHQTGEAEQSATAESYASLAMAAQVDAFIDDMASAYHEADIVICRAGAMTVAELTAAGKPAIFVPYPFAIDDHQTENARWLADSGAAVLLPEGELASEALVERLAGIFSDADALQSMGDIARSLAAPDAALRVRDHCLQLCGESAHE